MKGNTGSSQRDYSPFRSELVWALIIGLLGIVPRLVFVTLFPTKPVSDFRGIVDFAVALRDTVLAKGAWHWEYFNPGLPTILSLILRIFPASPEVTARWATALVTGLIPLIPYVGWRGIVSTRARIVTGVMLAVWPGQIFFSGVVAQDNWVIVPSVALAVLAVRSLLTQDGGHPFCSAFLLILGTFIRQEMIVVLLPVALVSAGLGAGSKRLVKNLVVWTAVVSLLLLIIAGQRAAATGRFAFTTEHGGMAILGAYAPGAGLNLWTDPRPYVATVNPPLLEDNKRLHEMSYRLALQEAMRRPGFHTVRVTSSVLNSLLSDSSNLYWSLTHADVLSGEYQQRASLFREKAVPFLKGQIMVIHTLFLASFFIALAKGNWPILITTVVIVLKAALHAVTVSQPRYFMVVIALEILVIPLGIEEAVKRRQSAAYALSLAAAGILTLLLTFAAFRAQAFVLAHDEIIQERFSFSLAEESGLATLGCVVEHGKISALNKQSVNLELLRKDPSPGETATASCRLTGSGTPVPLVLQVFDPYAPGGFPDRIAQKVTVDGRELLYHDIAAVPGSGWLDVPLGLVGRDTDKTVLVEIIAIRPDPGPAWGAAAGTQFRLAPDGIP